MLCAVFAVAGFALSAKTIGFDWMTFDDPRYVLGQDSVVRFGEASWRERLLTPAMGHPMPFTNGSLVLDYLLYRYDAGGFHRTNVLWFSALCGLVPAWIFGFGRLRGRSFSVPAVAAGAALVVVHPVNVEAVAWITSRKDLCATFFAVAALTVVALGAGAQRIERPRSWRPFLGAALLVLALASKGSVVLVPVLWLAVGWWAGAPRRTYAALGSVCLVLGGAVAVVARRAQIAGGTTVTDLGEGSWLGGLGQIASGLAGRCVGLLPRPPVYVGLFRSPEPWHAVLGALIVLGLIAALVVAGLALRSARPGGSPTPELVGRPGVAVGFISLAFVCLYLPVSGVPGRIEMFVADRYLLPVVVIVAPLATAIATDAAMRACGRNISGVTALVLRATTVAVLVLVFGRLAMVRDGALDDWERGEALWAAQRAVVTPTPEHVASGAWFWTCRQDAVASGAYVVGWGVPRTPDPAQRRLQLERTARVLAECLAVDTVPCGEPPSRACRLRSQLEADQARARSMLRRPP